MHALMSKYIWESNSDYNTVPNLFAVKSLANFSLFKTHLQSLSSVWTLPIMGTILPRLCALFVWNNSCSNKTCCLQILEACSLLAGSEVCGPSIILTWGCTGTTDATCNSTFWEFFFIIIKYNTCIFL